MPKTKPIKTELARFKALSDMGLSAHAIGKRTGKDPKTVRKYLNSEAINDPYIKVIAQKIKDAELNDLLLLNQKARANLHKRFDEGSPNVIESTAVMDRTFGQIRLLQDKSTGNVDIHVLHKTLDELNGIENELMKSIKSLKAKEDKGESGTEPKKNIPLENILELKGKELTHEEISKIMNCEREGVI